MRVGLGLLGNNDNIFPNDAIAAVCAADMKPRRARRVERERFSFVENVASVMSPQSRPKQRGQQDTRCIDGFIEERRTASAARRTARGRYFVSPAVLASRS